MEQSQNPTMGAIATTNQQQPNRRFWTDNPFLVFEWKSNISENLNIDAIDKNTRLKN